MALIAQQRTNPADVNHSNHLVDPSCLRCIRKGYPGALRPKRHWVCVINKVSPVPNVNGFPGVYSDDTLASRHHIAKMTGQRYGRLSEQTITDIFHQFIDFLVYGIFFL